MAQLITDEYTDTDKLTDSFLLHQFYWNENTNIPTLECFGDSDSGKLWKIVSRGPRVFSKTDLIRKDYPSPSQESYLVIQLELVTDSEFEVVRWNFKHLKNYSSGRASAFPFTASLAELMKHKIKE
ncbi:MAG: hypothetical protein ACI8TA_003267 [Cyclobacteriaceae bacterium]|jgi:hypothetical protein